MDILSFLSSRTKAKENIVNRLLEEGVITSKEAVILLKSTENITIEKIEISSGAKVVAGDNTDYR